MNKTQIFKSINEFWNREDSKVNGVSEDFAKNNPNWEKENETNEGCWNCSYCSDCSGCSGARGWKNNTQPINLLKDIPKIENIHQKVLEAVSHQGALDMGDWHKDKSLDEAGAYCGTTHCRAGWVVTLAGKAGRDLEQFTSTLFAAQLIYKESSDIKVSPPRFYESNEKAMADMKRCAEL